MFPSSCVSFSFVFLCFFILFFWFRFKGKQRIVRTSPITDLRTVRFDRGSHGSLLFSHRTVLDAKRTTKMNGSRFFRSDCSVWSGFQNLDQKTLLQNPWMMSLKMQILSLIYEYLMAGGLFFSVSFYHQNTLPLGYFTTEIFYCQVISVLQYAFYCADMSTVGSVFVPPHNPCQSHPRPKV